MSISINDPLQSTYIFIVIFALALFWSVRKSGDDKFFSSSVTQELKGFAILAVVFSHVDYFQLVEFQRYLNCCFLQQVLFVRYCYFVELACY